MKKIKKGTALIIMFIMFFVPRLVSAASKCSSEEQIQLQKEAINVNGNYSLKEVVKDFDGEIVDVDLNDVHQDDDYYSDTLLFLEIRNVTENMYIKILEDGIEVANIDYDDTNSGDYVYQVPDVEKIRTYEIRIFSDISNCRGEEVHNLSVITPMRNPLASLAACMNVEEAYCDEFITSNLNITEDEIIKRKDAYTQQQEEQEKNQNNFLTKYGIYILIVIIVIGVVSTVIILVKRRRSRVL